MLPQLPTVELTLEQQFQMRAIRDILPKMSPEQMQQQILEMSQLLMLRENMIKGLTAELMARL
jgi:Phycobilisome degradation protein nblA